MDAPKHTTESHADRKKQRDLASARASGSAAPAMDVKTGQMINPHNPEFITKKPWYLGDNTGGPSLDHQNAIDKEADLSLAAADLAAKSQRDAVKAKIALVKATGKGFEVGMWVEALRLNRRPYLMAKVTRVSRSGDEVDLQFEDGGVEKNVRVANERVKATKVGAAVAVQDGQHGKVSYASKRDAYHGYDAEDHKKTIDRFNEQEALRKKVREEESRKKKEEATKQKEEAKRAKKEAKEKKLAEGGDASESDSDSDSDSESDSESDGGSGDEFKQKDTESKRFGGATVAAVGGTGNLRIREDTAKYLRNLDLDSAYYDPKSRSMRDNPNPDANPNDLQFAGDNFARVSGGAIELAQTQLFAWDAQAKGLAEVHLQANPSQAELMMKKFKKQTEVLKVERKKAVLDKYGGEEYLDGDDGLGGGIGGVAKERVGEGGETYEERKLRIGGVSVENKEYSREGRVVKGGGPKVAVKSKYEEDVFTDGHSCIWGSYFLKGAFRWGYADDHSLSKGSYNGGEVARAANDSAHAMKYGTGATSIADKLAKAQAAAAAAQQLAANRVTAAIAAAAATSSSKAVGAGERVKASELYGEAGTDIKLDKEKLKEALKREEEHRNQFNVESDDRKRKYGSIAADVKVTAEEMEAYRLKKNRAGDDLDDIGSEEVLEYKK